MFPLGGSSPPRTLNKKSIKELHGENGDPPGGYRAVTLVVKSVVESEGSRHFRPSVFCAFFYRKPQHDIDAPARLDLQSFNQLRAFGCPSFALGDEI